MKRVLLLLCLLLCSVNPAFGLPITVNFDGLATGGFTERVDVDGFIFSGWPLQIRDYYKNGSRQLFTSSGWGGSSIIEVDLPYHAQTASVKIFTGSDYAWRFVSAYSDYAYVVNPVALVQNMYTNGLYTVESDIPFNHISLMVLGSWRTGPIPTDLYLEEITIDALNVPVSDPAPVPEPATALLLGAGLGALALTKKKKAVPI